MTLRYALLPRILGGISSEEKAARCGTFSRARAMTETHRHKPPFVASARRRRRPGAHTRSAPTERWTLGETTGRAGIGGAVVLGVSLIDVG